MIRLFSLIRYFVGLSYCFIGNRMKILIYSFILTISSCSAGLLGTPLVSSQDNSIQSVANSGIYSGSAYFGNYQPTGQLAFKYLPTTATRGYTSTPFYMRFGTGNYITNGLFGSVPVTSPVAAPLTTQLPAYMYSAALANSSPKYLRIIQRPGSIADAYRPTANYLTSAPKYFGSLPLATPSNYYNSLNTISSPPVKSIRPIYNPTPAVSAIAPQQLETTAVSRNHYQTPKIYNTPSTTQESSYLPSQNSQPQTFTITNYGDGMTRVSGINGLSPDITNAIMKILQDPSSSSGSITQITAPDSSNSYLNGADVHSSEATNTIDNSPSATTNQNVQITNPIETVPTYSDHNHQNVNPTNNRNFGKFGNMLQVYCDEDNFNQNMRNYRIRRPNPLYHAPQRHQLHRFLPPIRHQLQHNSQHPYQYQNQQLQSQQQQQQQQQNFASFPYNDTGDTIPQIQSNLNTETNEVVSESSNVPDSESRFL